MITCRQGDNQQTPFFLGIHVEKRVRRLFGDKGKFARTQLQMLFLNLKLKCSFEDEKCLVVIVLVEWRTLLRRDSSIEEGKGAAGVSGDREKCYYSTGNLEGLPFPKSFRLHDSILPFSRHFYWFSALACFYSKVYTERLDQTIPEIWDNFATLVRLYLCDDESTFS